MYRRKKEEMKTRTFMFDLTQSDILKFVEKCYSDGTTPEEVLRGFICDLVYSDYSNGSDERDFANRYYNRVGYRYGKSPSFLQWCINCWMLDDVINLIDDIEENKEEIDFCKYDPAARDDPEALGESLEDHIKSFEKFLDEDQKKLNEYYNNYVEDTTKDRYTPEDLETGIDGIRKYTEMIENIERG